MIQYLNSNRGKHIEIDQLTDGEFCLYVYEHSQYINSHEWKQSITADTLSELLNSFFASYAE